MSHQTRPDEPGSSPRHPVPGELESVSETRRLEAALAGKVVALESLAQRSSKLQKMMATLAATLSVADGAVALADHGPALFGATAAALYLLDDDRTHLRLAAFGGVSAERVAAYRDIPLAGDQAHMEPFHHAPFRELWAPEHRAAAQSAVDVARAGARAEFTGICPTTTGKQLWWSVTMVPAPGPRGQPDRLVAISHVVPPPSK